MNKKIPPKSARIGMYVLGFEGSWLKHPFWRSSFRIETAEQLSRIRESAGSAVLIDIERGVDIEPSPGEPTTPAPATTIIVTADLPPEPGSPQALHASPQQAPRESPPPALQRATPPPHTPPTATPPTLAGEVSIEEELERARSVCLRARSQITDMFHEARLGKAVDSASVLPLVDEISQSVMRNPSAIISLARLKTKDDYTFMHSVAVCALMIGLSRQLGLSEDETREAGFAGLLHDIGKMAIPLDVLNKPGRLDDHEFAVVRNHPRAGADLLLDSGGVGEVQVDVALHHHERMDGTGYPDRLGGDAISLFSRMGAVCDVYDAITSNRPYKAGWSPCESLRRMNQWRDGHFDERVFQAFVKTVGIYPVGSLVRLESGRLATVIDQTDESMLKPVVLAFFCTRSGERISPQRIDLARPDTQDHIVGFEDPARWKFPEFDQLLHA